MALSELIIKYQTYPKQGTLLKNILDDAKKRICVKGLKGSSKSVLTATILPKIEKPNLFIFDDKDEAAYFYNDLNNLIGDTSSLFFPSSYKRSVKYDQIDSGGVILRTDVLNKITELKTGKPKNFPLRIITYSEALLEKVVTHSNLQKNTLHLSVGEKISIQFIEEVLSEYKFEYQDFVYEPGQYAIRGSIVDIFSYSSNNPYRIDFFGDEVESIRTFNVENQLSETKHNKISIIPNIHEISMENIGKSFLNFIPGNTNIWISDIKYISGKMNEIFEKTSVIENEHKKPNLISGYSLIEKMHDFKTIELNSKPFFNADFTLEFNTKSQPVFNKNFNLLGDNLEENHDNGFECFILSDSEKQINRLTSIFHELNKKIKFTALLKTLHEGFIDIENKIVCYTDHQIFERFHKYRLNAYFSNKATLSIKELKGLNVGDYVVHIDHGIGKFGGLHRIDVNGKKQEVIRLIYKDNDILFVSIHSLHRISKYKGKDEQEPKIYKLGSGAWQKLKQTTKKKIKDIAKDLIALYAKRKSEKGFQFTTDTYLQDELEASFIFEDTPDQITATKAVKDDMESDIPMDRLICGDVGFGKTEIAIRAAFKAAVDGKQTAVLVPTTILALQHYQTFRERLKEFPCTVEYISRLKNTKRQKDVVQKLNEGKIDILIGTHRILGKDIVFKDLGLLVIDEEQKFGVSAKEKLKSLKINVDTITMTATPIPRTLQFSILGARDLSIINTPPPNRHPIVTEVHTFNEEIIKEGIDFEVSRGGQVFFIHNRIQNIIEVELLIRKICPEVNVITAHGQMEGPKLEKIMLDFIQGDYNVLVSTTIIESGLDIPNANTIFINNAHHFGLSDLHQLRGRVGRSNRKAFCYMLAPPLHLVTSESRRRLKAIEEFSDLGSGFYIAMQDLDIRGAGNLLGAEQSGFIADIGFETYNRILNEAMQELKEEEFKDLFTKSGKEKETTHKKKKYIHDCQIDTDMEILFPDYYISNITERIDLYRTLDNLKNEEELTEFEKNIVDRFGPIPEQTVELIEVVKLRWLALELGMSKIIMKNNKMICYFIPKEDSSFYKSEEFSKIIAFLQKKPQEVQMKEAKGKLYLTVNKVTTVRSALQFLNKILE